jgi:hypothetical protein
MRKILAGLETEYGLLVSGRGAADQIDDAMALVRSYPGECLPIWDYRYESPRSDLRGFKQQSLTFDPEDAKFDEGKARGPDPEVRSDRILPNGARFYNDHGHPEYSTPECLSLQQLARHDRAGELAVLSAAKALEESGGSKISIYKNNTDFHGASYGTHENYLVPRELGFERLLKALLPILVVRQILTGAGKVGAETGNKCPYQLSQRADFFSELATVDTLFRRPLFNTRDEPHADPKKWIRLHVISGDANMMASCTARKVGLVKLALNLLESGYSPEWKLSDPVRAFQGISRDETYQFSIPLEGRSWTTPTEILESYFSVAEVKLELEPEMCALIGECRGLLEDLRLRGHAGIARHVDWAAKRVMLESFMEEEGGDWSDPNLTSYDLEYHNIDPEEGLYHALVEMDAVEKGPSLDELAPLLSRHTEPTRAFARGLAASKFGDEIASAAWRSVTFRDGEELLELELPPDRTYPAQLDEAQDVGTFIEMIGGTE